MGFLGVGFCGTRLLLLLFKSTALLWSSVAGGACSMDSEVHKEPAEPCKNHGGNFLVVVIPPDKPPRWPVEEQA